MKITKIFTFDSSHMLDGHDGKCQNLHGHTYKLEITVSAPVIQGGAKDGMVMDFTDLKAIVKQHITDPFDHAFIYHDNNERESQIAALLAKENVSIEALIQKGVIDQTTAEIVILTHSTVEKNIKRAIAAIEALSCVEKPITMIRMESLHD